MEFRVFSNDRGKEKGVPMYSCLFARLQSPSLAGAEAAARTEFAHFDAPAYAPLKVVHWPPKTAAEKAWINKHVGGKRW